MFPSKDAIEYFLAKITFVNNLLVDFYCSKILKCIYLNELTLKFYTLFLIYFIINYSSGVSIFL